MCVPHSRNSYVSTSTSTSRHIIIINGERGHAFEKSKEGVWGYLEEGRGRENDVIIL